MEQQTQKIVLQNDQQSLKQDIVDENEQIQNLKIIQEELENFHIEHKNLIHKNSNPIQDEYEFIKIIGKGGMSEVKYAVHKKTGIARAIKILNKIHLTPNQIRQSIKEISILAKLDHPNIAQIHEYFQDDRFIYVVEDFYSGGEMVDKVVRDDDEEGLSEHKAAKIMKQVFSALKHCHEHNVAYRDLKPENIMLTHNSYDHLKIVDFGLSYSYKTGEVLTEKVGTPYYVAPEVLNGAHTEKCDMWSAGVLMYLILVGYPPFEGDTDQEIFYATRQGKFEMLDYEWQNISQSAKDLINCLLRMDPSDRYSAEQAMNHKWIQEFSSQPSVDEVILNQSLVNLKKFKRGSKLAEAIHLFIVDNIISRREKQDLQACFQAIDTDGDGHITKQDLFEAYKTTKKHYDEQYLQQITQSLDDTFGDSKINFSEWLNATVEQSKLLSAENLEAAFKMFDQDHDGKLSVKDIKNIFSCGKNLHDETWEALIKEMDHNESSSVSHSDFFKAMQNYIHETEPSNLRNIKNNSNNNSGKKNNDSPQPIPDNDIENNQKI